MTRIFHGRVDLLTSFDRRARTFKVIVVLSTDYHSHAQKTFFGSSGHFQTFFWKMLEKLFRNHKNELKWDLPISVLTPHQKLLSDLFPFYSFESNESERHQVAEAFEEFPSEFSFHRKIAPSVPSFSTPSFFSPPCSFCTAKVNL